MKASPSLSLRLNSVVVLILAVMMCQSAVTESFLNKFSVMLVNNLKNHTLEAHCKSKDDDLGLQHIGVHQEIKWHFRINYFSSTLYYCNTWWVGGHKTFDVFTVDERFIVEHCAFTYCKWKGQEDGIYVYSEKHKQYRLMYQWEH